MTTYFLHPVRKHFQPDRRRDSKNGEGAHRRERDAQTIDQSQYDFLRDCLLRRESLRHAMNNRERRARHILAAIVALFVALLFAAGSQTIDIKLPGVSFALSVIQLVAIAPFSITYLVVYASTLAARQERLDQEIGAIDHELRKFGCPTSFSIVEPLRAFCANKKVPRGTKSYSKWFHRVFNAHDAVLGGSVFLAYIIAVVKAMTLYPDTPIALAVGLYLLALTLAGLVAVYGAFATRRRRGQVLRDFQARHTLEDSETNGGIAKGAVSLGHGA